MRLRSYTLAVVGHIGAPGPLPSQQRDVVFSSLGVSVVDFRCRAHVEPEGAEEPNPTHNIALVRRGVFQRTYQRDRFVADPTSVLFFNRNEPSRYAHPLPGGDDCTILTLETPRALELVGRHAPGDAQRPETPFRLGYGICSARSARLHYELLARVRAGPVLAIEDVLAELTDEVMRDAYRTHARAARVERISAGALRRQHDLVEAVKLQLNEHLDSLPSLGELARIVGCSPFHLSRTFHRTAGVSLRRYLARLRTGIAAHALAGGARGLSELALELGYADHSHFTNAFRSEWGIPPSRFRRLLGPRRENPAPAPS